MARAAAVSGRGPDAVTLLAVSKGQPLASVHGAHSAGLRHFGENYVQEALPKIDACDADCVWHFIGRSQSNKARELASRFSWVQSVSSARLAERLSAQRPYYGEPLQVCIQLQATGAAERGGCPPGDVIALADVIAGLPRLRLRGLMLLPAAGLDEPGLRQAFSEAREKLQELHTAGHPVDTLSMGMSDDFEIAIEEGSTMVRIGTALFGPRNVAGPG